MVLYLFYIMFGIYKFVDGGVTIIRIVLMALSFITILALAGRAGEWARLTAIVFAGAMLLLGFALIGMSIWSALATENFIGFLLLGGIIIAPISACTIHVLRKRVSALSVKAA